MNYAYAAIAESMKKGAPPDLICGTCRWDVTCVQAPEMTTEQVEAQVEKVAAGRPGGKPLDPPSALALRLTAVAMFGERDQLARMCPVLVARLRTDDGRTIADALKATMRGLTA